MMMDLNSLSSGPSFGFLNECHSLVQDIFVSTPCCTQQAVTRFEAVHTSMVEESGMHVAKTSHFCDFERTKAKLGKSLRYDCAPSRTRAP